MRIKPKSESLYLDNQEMLTKIYDRLEAIPIWNYFLENQKLVWQIPDIKQKTGDNAYLYGCNDTGFVPKHTIQQIILTEILLRVLDKLESIKYSAYYVNATSAIAYIFPTRKLDSNEYLGSLEYIFQTYINNSLHTVSTFEPSVQYEPNLYHKITVSANGNRKKTISEFYSEYTEFLTDLKIFQKNNKIFIPLYNIPVLSQKFAVAKMKASLKQINRINTLESNIKYKSIRYKGAIYWQYYKNTQLWEIRKERRLEYYKQLFSEASFLKRLYVDVCPDMDSTSKILECIHENFFNEEIISKYKSCDLPDYLICVYIFFIYEIICHQRKSKYDFTHRVQILKRVILQLMDMRLSTIINPIIDDMFNGLLEKHNNSIDRAEEDLVTQLEDYVAYENHYNISPTNKPINHLYY